MHILSSKCLDRVNNDDMKKVLLTVFIVIDQIFNTEKLIVNTSIYL